MAFKITHSDNTEFSTPQEMFQDNKSKTIKGILDYQSEMLTNYLKTLDGEIIKNKNVAFEMPTGSGKTLVGILIAEFHRRKYNRRALFLCPTRQLVIQVCEQAKNQYGIDAIPFIGPHSEFSTSDLTRFMTKKSIGVTTYSSFFSFGKTFDNTEILIFDDVHSSELFISDNWSLCINRFNDKYLFEQLVGVLSNVLDESDMAIVTQDGNDGVAYDWNNMIPRHLLTGIIGNIYDILNNGVKNSEHQYSWNRISEHLIDCQFYISWDNILIRPFIPPTETHNAFSQSKQRIFMSATLGNSGELERITGCKKIKRLPIVSDWDKKGLGRKLFIFPDLSLKTEAYNEIIIKLHKLAKRSVMIVPSDYDYNYFKELLESEIPGISIFRANDLISNKDEYVNSTNSMVIMANRFDGVDFPDEESRMLFIYNLPKYTHLQEKFFVGKMAASALFAERIKTRIVQAVGRCTRNSSDFSVVCVLGKTILNDLTSEDIIRNYHPELRAEIQFGLDQSTDFSNVDDIIENVKIFYSKDSNWLDAEKMIVDNRNRYAESGINAKQKNTYDKLLESAEHEVDIQYCIWNHNYHDAFEKAQQIVEIMNMPTLTGYKCFWQYICSGLALEINENKKSLFYIREAMKNSKGGIRWFNDIVKSFSNEEDGQTESDYVYDIIERLETQIKSISVNNKLEKTAKTIIDNLSSNDGDTFERGHVKLGELMGYISRNSSETAAPDPYWIINENLCVVAEDKIYESDNQQIPVNHVRQANSHDIWIRSNETFLRSDAKIIKVFVSNAISIQKNAKIYAKDLYYVNRNDFCNWAQKAINALRTAKGTFTEEGDSEWREKARNILSENGVTPSDFISFVKSKKLVDLNDNDD